MARRYTIAGRRFSKVASGKTVHVVEDGKFWKGEKSWQHLTVAGESITGVTVELQRVNCRACRRVIEEIGNA